MGMPRKHTVDDEFFNKIDSEEKAYFLGLMCADGYLPTRGNAIGIDLNKRDLHLLRAFKRSLKFSGSPYRTNHGMYRLLVTSRELKDALIKRGLDSDKTNTLSKVSGIPTKQFRHFARGFFDGDGSWTYALSGSKAYPSTYKKRLRMHMRGTKAFCDFLAERFPVECWRSFSKTWILGLSKKEDIVRFGEWLYKDATIFMRRKRQRFESKTRECHKPSNRL